MTKIFVIDRGDHAVSIDADDFYITDGTAVFFQRTDDGDEHVNVLALGRDTWVTIGIKKPDEPAIIVDVKDIDEPEGAKVEAEPEAEIKPEPEAEIKPEVSPGDVVGAFAPATRDLTKEIA